MPSTPSKAVSHRRNGSAARHARSLKRESDPGPLPEPVREWVDEQPWAMVGAAAGVGLALGAASRSSRMTGNAVQMIAATASGVAVRVAMNALLQWLEPKLEKK